MTRTRPDRHGERGYALRRRRAGRPTPVRPTPVRRWAAVGVVVALLASGCGGTVDRSVATTDDVVAALVALGDDGLRTRWTADLEVDEGELRALLREDDDMRALLTERTRGSGGNGDELLERVTELGDELDRHAVLVEVGADQSVRWAIESDGAVWVDWRVHGDRATEQDDVLAPFDLTLQGLVDLDAAASLVDDATSPSIADRVARLDQDLARTRTELVGVLPAVEPLFDLLADLLAGQLVTVDGQVDPREWLGSLAPSLGVTTGEAEQELRSRLEQHAATTTDVSPEQLLRTLLSFDGFRADGDDTVVDVSVEVRRAGAFVLDGYDRLLAAGTPSLPRGQDDESLRQHLERARAALDDAPERLADVATLRFDADGRLVRLEVSLLDLAAPAAATTEPDEDHATVVDALARLERTGIVVTADVGDHGAVESVLADKTATTMTWDQLRQLAAAGAGMVGALGGLDAIGGATADVDAGDVSARLSAGHPTGLRPDQLAVGDCFDDEALSAATGAGTTVPCEEPHDNEVVALLEVDPGDDRTAVEQLAGLAAACDESFEEYVGTPPRESGLFHRLLEPSRSQWQEQGVRTFACYLYSFSPEIGSAAGSGR